MNHEGAAVFGGRPGRFGGAAMAVLALSLSPWPFVVEAGQVRLSGGNGTPSVIEVLTPTSFQVNPATTFSGYALIFSIPNSVTNLPYPGVWFMTSGPAFSVYKAASGTTQLLGTDFNGNYGDYRLNSLECRQNGSGFSFAANFPNAAEYQFQQNDIITLIAGTYPLATTTGTSTDGNWLAPGTTYELTPSSFSTASEGTPYSPTDVTVVPEPVFGGVAALLLLVTARAAVRPSKWFETRAVQSSILATAYASPGHIHPDGAFACPSIIPTTGRTS